MKSWLSKLSVLISPTAVGIYVTLAFTYSTLSYYATDTAGHDSRGVIQDLLVTAHQKSVDFRLKSRGPRQGSEHVGLLTVDEKAVATVGRWPWPREVLARAIDNAAKFGAKVLAFDMVFSEPSAQPAKDVYEELRAQGDIPASIQQQLEKSIRARDSDRALRDVFISHRDRLVMGSFGEAGVELPSWPLFDSCVDLMFQTEIEFEQWITRESSSLISLEKFPSLPTTIFEFYKDHLSQISSAIRSASPAKTALEEYAVKTKIQQSLIDFCTRF